jgi:hypothetical protein
MSTLGRLPIILLEALRPKIKTPYMVYRNAPIGNHQGEAPMRKFTIAAATVAIAALTLGAPASAERNQGEPIKKNGQCWKQQRLSEAGTWGYWQACPEKASSPTVRQPTRHRV